MGAVPVNGNINSECRLGSQLITAEYAKGASHMTVHTVKALVICFGEAGSHYSQRLEGLGHYLGHSSISKSMFALLNTCVQLPEATSSKSDKNNIVIFRAIGVYPGVSSLLFLFYTNK